MIQFIFVLLTTTGILTFINVWAVKFFKDNPYVFFIVFILNTLALFVLSHFYKKKNTESKEDESSEISEKSVAIFIRLIIYIFPIVALFGLYFVGIVEHKNKLGIEDANSWVGFILGIAAFIMSLITLWQGEGTYNKIFSALEELRRSTDDIKRNTDITEYLKADGLGLKRNLPPTTGPSGGQPQSQPETDNQENGGIQSDGNEFMETMNKNPFKK